MTSLPPQPCPLQLPLAFGNNELKNLNPNERDQVIRHLARLLIEAAGLGREEGWTDDL